MNEKNDFELNLAKMLRCLLSFLPVVLLITCAVSIFSYFHYRTPVAVTYNGKATFFAGPNIARSESTSDHDDIGDVTMAETFSAFASIDTLCFLSTSPSVLEVVIDQSGLPYSPDELSRMVTARQEPATYAFSVNVYSSDETEALQIAQAFAAHLPPAIEDLNPSSIIRVVNNGSVSAQSSGGINKNKVVISAGISAFVLIALIIFLFIIREYAGKNKINLFELKRLYPKYNILSIFSSRNSEKAISKLRVNIHLALCGHNGCKMIGITSVNSRSSSSKDDLAVSLARSLAKQGDRVLLVDADFSSSRILNSLRLSPRAGLYELLCKNEEKLSVIQTVDDDSHSFSFISSGYELATASFNFEKLLPILSEVQTNYDYILVVFDPVNTSVETAPIWKSLDGIILSLLDHSCSRAQLSECISQLNFASANLLGFAVNKRIKNNLLP